MRSVLTKTLILGLIVGLAASPSMAQSSQQEDESQQQLQGMAQIDITGGMADRSAHYAMQHVPPGASAPPPPGYPQPGYPQPGQYSGMQQPPGYPVTQVPPGYPPPTFATPAYPAGYPQYACPPPYGTQPYPTAPYGAPMAPYGAQYPYPAQQQMAPPQNYNQQPQSGGSGDTKIMSQMIGALGAATMLNYMTQGGMDTILSPLKARGWNNKFHTYGSCIGGNISPP